MLPALPFILKCPHCGGLSRLSSIVSGNTFGMGMWSDMKQHTPMLSHISAVQKCPSCGKYFFYEEAHIWGFCNSFGNSSMGHLSYTSLKKAYEQLQPTGEKEITLRIMLLHGYNDHYGGCPGTKLPDEAPASERTYFEQNARRLIELLPDDELLCAELYRELGAFEQCLSLLNKITAEGRKARFAAQIKERALKHDRTVFVLNNILHNGIRKAIEDEPCYVYDKEEDKANCRDGFFWDPYEEI